MSYAGANAWTTAGQGLHGLGTRIMQMALQKKEQQLAEQRHGEEMALRTRAMDQADKHFEANQAQQYTMGGFERVTPEGLDGQDMASRMIGLQMGGGLAPPEQGGALFGPAGGVGKAITEQALAGTDALRASGAEWAFNPELHPQSVMQDRQNQFTAGENREDRGLQRWQHGTPSGNAVLSESGANTRQAAEIAARRDLHTTPSGDALLADQQYRDGLRRGRGGRTDTTAAQYAAVSIVQNNFGGDVNKAIQFYTGKHLTPEDQEVLRELQRLAVAQGRRAITGAGDPLTEGLGALGIDPNRLGQ